MRVHVAAMAALCLVAGCTNPRAELDSLVEEIWIEANENRQVDAVEFLSSGKPYYQPGSPSGGEVDRTVILPLMKRLKDEFRAQPFVHIAQDDDTEEGYPWVICVKLPANSVARSGIARAVAEADQAFAGSILAEWGNRWLVLSFGEEGEFDEE